MFWIRNQNSEKGLEGLRKLSCGKMLHSRVFLYFDGLRMLALPYRLIPELGKIAEGGSINFVVNHGDQNHRDENYRDQTQVISRGSNIVGWPRGS